MIYLHCIPITAAIVLVVYWAMGELSLNYPEYF